MPRLSKTQELLEFEIAFYEALVRKYPDFPEALMALGDAYTRRGWHEKGLAVDLRLTQLKCQDPIAWYNLACSYALLRRSDEAFEALQRAFALGYDDLAHLMRDPDLALLRRSPKLRRLLEQQFSGKPS